MLGNGPLVLGNGNWLLLLGTGHVAFIILSHLGFYCLELCHSGLCCIQGNDVQDYVAFGLMSFEIMLFKLMSFGIMLVYH